LGWCCKLEKTRSSKPAFSASLIYTEFYSLGYIVTGILRGLCRKSPRNNSSKTVPLEVAFLEEGTLRRGHGS